MDKTLSRIIKAPEVSSGTTQSVRTAALVPLLLLSCLLPPVLFGMTYVVPNPELYLTRPGATMPPYFTRDPLGSVLEMSLARFSRQRLLSGEFPLWNPYSALGHPFYPDTNLSALASPVNILRLILPPADWSLVFIANILLGAWFTYLLVRAYGVSREGGAIAAVSFFALGAVQVYVAVSSIILVYAWLPLVLYGVERGLSPGSSRLRWLPATLGVYGLLTGGHTTITLLCGFTVGIYLVLRLIGSDLRLAARTVLWLGIGVLVAAPQWLPFVYYVLEYGNNFEDYSDRAFRAMHLASWVLPHIYGSLNSPTSVIVNAPSLGLYSSLGWLSPALGFLLVAGGLSLVRQRPRGPLALAAAIVPLYLWAFGLPPLTWAADLPFVSRIQPSYLPLIGSVLLCVLVGIGSDFLTRCHPMITMLTAGAWLAVMALALAGATLWMDTTAVPIFSVFSTFAGRTAVSFAWAVLVPVIVYWRWGGGATVAGLVTLSAVGYFPWAWGAPVDRAAWLALAVGGTVFALAWFLQRVTGSSKWIAPAATLAPVILHIVLGPTPNRLPSRNPPYEPPSYASFLKAQGGNWRSFGMGGYLFPNFGAVSGIDSINALVEMFPRPAERLFAKYVNAHETPTQLLGLGHALADGTLWEPWQEVLGRRAMWDYLGVRYFVHRGGDLTQAKAPMFRYERADDETDRPVTAIPLLNTSGKPRDAIAPLDCTTGPVDAVAIRFGTYGTTREGVVELSVVGPGGGLLGRVQKEAARIRDNDFAEFVLPAPVCGGKTSQLSLRVRYSARSPVQPLAVWKSADHAGFVFRSLRLREVPSTGLVSGVTPVALTQGLEAPFKCPIAAMQSLRVYVGTHRKVNAGTLRIRIEDLSGTTRYASALDSAEIRDLEGVKVRLPTAVCRAGERLLLAVSHESARPGSGLALFAERDQPFKYEIYTDLGSNIVRRFDDPETGATVWENLQAQPRAYLAPEARRAPSWEAALDAFATSADLRRVAWFDDESTVQCPSGPAVSPGTSTGSVANLTVGVNHVDVAFDAPAPGTLVLTDAYMPGWTATVDGATQPVVRVNGVFRGVCIVSPGLHKIRFSYFPPGLLPGAGLAVLGLVLAITISRRSSIGVEPTESNRRAP